MLVMLLLKHIFPGVDDVNKQPDDVCAALGCTKHGVGKLGLANSAKVRRGLNITTSYLRKTK